MPGEYLASLPNRFRDLESCQQCLLRLVFEVAQPANQAVLRLRTKLELCSRLLRSGAPWTKLISTALAFGYLLELS